ncbi:MAG: hypothetical protein R3A79_09450 [Nannocystaceae bacterium]
MLTQLPVLALLLVAPATAVSPPEGAPESVQTPPQAYTQAEAQADIDTLLRDRGRDYLLARGRLEEHPTVAAPLVGARLQDAALGPAERQRLLALLGAFGRPEDLRAFAVELRRSAAAAAPGQAIPAVEPWRILLREQGAPAAEVLAELVGDRELAEDLRALLLGDLIEILPPEALPPYVALVGKGQESLRQALRRALARRARERPSDGPALLAAVDQAFEQAEASQKAALLGLRAALSDADDPAFTGRLVVLAEDAGAPFVVRVAALRLLGARASEAAIRDALVRLAAANLAADRREQQAAEILGWLALRALPDADAAALAARLELLGADAPRIASAAFAVAALPADGSWLEPALEHPWPEVRHVALGRVAAPCDRDVVRRLASAAGDPSKGGEADEAVAREAIRALGRCGDEAEAPLIKLLNKKTADDLRRAEAAKQLLVIGGARGDAAVAKALETLGDPSLVRRLVDAAQATEEASPALLRALCQVSADLPALRSSVAATLRTIAPGHACE